MSYQSVEPSRRFVRVRRSSRNVARASDIDGERIGVGCILVAVSTDSAQLFFSLLTFVAAAGAVALVGLRVAAGLGSESARRDRARDQRRVDVAGVPRRGHGDARQPLLLRGRPLRSVPPLLVPADRDVPAVGDPARRCGAARSGGALVRRPAGRDRRGGRRLPHAASSGAPNSTRGACEALRSVVHRRLVRGVRVRHAGHDVARRLSHDPLTHVRPLPGHTRRRCTIHRQAPAPLDAPPLDPTLESHS